MQTVREAIISSCDENYRKVAMVIFRASKAIGKSDDETYDLIGMELAKLVDEGHLQAIGDITLWRDSEVRKPRG